MIKFIQDFVWHQCRERGYQIRFDEGIIKNHLNVLGVLCELEFNSKNKPPFLLQIGCNDGLKGDPIHAFIKPNWRGLLVEPIPSVIEKLKKNRAFAQFAYDQCAVSDYSGTTQLGIPEDDRSASLSGNKIPMATKSTIETKVKTLGELLETNKVAPATVDIFFVDAEGHDYRIMRDALRLPSFRPKIIQFEHEYHMGMDEWKTLCVELGNKGYAVGTYRFDDYTDTIAYDVSSGKP